MKTTAVDLKPYTAPPDRLLWRLALCFTLLAAVTNASARSEKTPPRSPELEEAVRSVKHRTRGQILSAKTHRDRQRSYHKIRVLTPDGRVKNMRLPARNPGHRQTERNEKHDDDRWHHHP